MLRPRLRLCQAPRLLLELGLVTGLDGPSILVSLAGLEAGLGLVVRSLFAGLLGLLAFALVLVFVSIPVRKCVRSSSCSCSCS